MISAWAPVHLLCLPSMSALLDQNWLCFVICDRAAIIDHCPRGEFSAPQVRVPLGPNSFSGAAFVGVHRVRRRSRR
jgi:hypothetical protein